MTEVDIPCRLPGKEVPRAYCAGVLGGRGQEGGLALGETLGGAAACCSDLSSVDSRRDLLCRIDSHLLLSP